MTNRAAHTDLFTPITLGPLTLPNRIVMAPLTRNRAGAGQVPTEYGVLGTPHDVE